MKPHLILSLLSLTFASASASDIITVRLPEGSLQPRCVSASNGSSAVVYLQGDPKASAVKIATLSSSGALSAPLQVNTSDTQAVAMGTVRGPSIALGAQDTRHVLWHGRSGTAANGKGSALYFASADTNGKTTPPQDMMGSTTALDGGAAVVANAAGHVWLVWHASPAGQQGEGARRLYIRQSADNGATFGEPWIVKGEDMGICGCCGLAASVDASGSLQILYRTAEGGSQRGARLIRLPANATTTTMPELLNQDRWEMPGCPMTTAALLPDSKQLITAWVTDFKMQFAGWNPSALGDNKAMQNHPRLARNAAGETLLIWTEGAMWGKGGELVSQTVAATGKPLGVAQRQQLPTWTYGACAALADDRFALLY